VEEYRLNHEDANEGYDPFVSSPRRGGRQGRSGPSRTYVAAVAVTGGLVLLLIVLLATGGGSSSKNGQAAHTATGTPTTSARHAASHPRPTIVALSLKPTAAVYVCLIGDHGRKLVPGLELQAGESTATYHAHRFLLTLGNSSVTMYVDGRPRSVPPSSQPIGYTITRNRGRQPLTGTQLPTCR
jgi:hypothetical protein